MAKPVLASFAQALYDSMTPMQYAEASYDYALAKLLSGIGEAFQQVEDYGRDQGDTPGWAFMLDPDTCPPEALGWLAQFVGVVLQPGLSEADQRARIKATDGWNRGTVGAIKGAAAQYLTGNKTVTLRERDGDPYFLTVITYTSQTPNPAQVLAAVTAQKPAGLVLTHNVTPGQDYRNIRDSGMTYAALRSKYATYNGLRADMPGT